MTLQEPALDWACQSPMVEEAQAQKASPFPKDVEMVNGYWGRLFFSAVAAHQFLMLLEITTDSPTVSPG